LKPNKDVIVDDDQEGPLTTGGSSGERTTERRKSSFFKTSRIPVEKSTEPKKGKRSMKKEKPV